MANPFSFIPKVLRAVGLLNDGLDTIKTTIRIGKAIAEEIVPERDEIAAARGVQTGQVGHDAASNAGPKGREREARRRR